MPLNEYEVPIDFGWAYACEENVQPMIMTVHNLVMIFEISTCIQFAKIIKISLYDGKFPNFVILYNNPKPK